MFYVDIKQVFTPKKEDNGEKMLSIFFCSICLKDLLFQKKNWDSGKNFIIIINRLYSGIHNEVI